MLLLIYISGIYNPLQKVGRNRDVILLLIMGFLSGFSPNTRASYVQSCILPPQLMKLKLMLGLLFFAEPGFFTCGHKKIRLSVLTDSRICIVQEID